MKPKNKNTHTVIFRCSDDLHKQVEKLSDLSMIPISIICRQALTEYIKNHSVDIIMQDPTEPKPVVHKPAPPKAQVKKRVYDADERRLDEWVASLGGEVEPVDKHDAYGDDW